jgi:hypothetical protein
MCGDARSKAVLHPRWILTIGRRVFWWGREKVCDRCDSARIVRWPWRKRASAQEGVQRGTNAAVENEEETRRSGDELGWGRGSGQSPEIDGASR